MDNYNFSLNQKEVVNNLLNSEFDSMWNGIPYNDGKRINYYNN